MSENNPQALQQIGELMGFMRLQSTANLAVMTKLESISTGIAALRESNVAFEGHRTRMHERFGEISTKITEQSLYHAKMDERVIQMEKTLANWRLTMVIIGAACTVGASIISILAVVFGAPLVKTLIH